MPPLLQASLCSGTSTTARHPSRHACTAPEPETWDAAAAHTELHQLRKGQARTPRVLHWGLAFTLAHWTPMLQAATDKPAQSALGETGEQGPQDPCTKP